MKVRVLAVGLLALIQAACGKPRATDPYWTQMDAIYQEAARTFTAGYSGPGPQAIEQLERLRQQAAALPHPDYADKYHALKIDEIDSGIRLLTAVRDHDTAGAGRWQKQLIDQRQKAYDEKRLVLGISGAAK